MAAKIKKRADGRYSATITLGRNPDGKYIRKYVYAKTQPELKQRIKELERQHDQGVDIIGTKPTVKAWADKWLEVYKPDLRRSMRSVYVGLIKKWLAPIHTMQMDKVRQVDLQGALLEASKTLSQSTVDKLYNCICGVFSTARRNGIVALDVTDGLVKPSNGKEQKRTAITAGEQETLRRACATLPREGAAPMLMLYAGLRIGEVFALTWGDIKDGYVKVSKTIVYEKNRNAPSVKPCPKTEAGFRSVPITAPLLEALDKVPRNDIQLDTDHIFVSKGKLYSRGMKFQFWDRIMAAYAAQHKKEWDDAHSITSDTEHLSEVYTPPKEFTAHTLRHTFATTLYDAGIDVKTAQKWMGHSTVAVLMDIYTHLSRDRELTSEEKLKAFLGGNGSDNTVDNRLTTETPENAV